MHDSPQTGSVANLYATLWQHAAGRRRQVVLFVVLLVLAQVVRLTIPWFFGEGVNALKKRGMEGLTQARNDLLLMLAAVGVAWTMHGPARILERFTALVVRERFADALHAKALALPVRWARAVPFRRHAAPDDQGDDLVVVVRPVAVHLPAEQRERPVLQGEGHRQVALLA